MKTDFLIIGAGIVGLSVARALQERFPTKSISIIEKERDVAMHASGRNSGVLHAGFYYTADSLKARFTREGNARLKAFCQDYGLPINACKKVVIARNEAEVQTLHELENRGRANGVDVRIIDEKELEKIDPNANTFGYALYSPTTATVNPKAVVRKLRDVVIENGAKLHLNTRYLYRTGLNRIKTDRSAFEADVIINCAGLYADRIAKQFGFGDRFTIVPFKGIYLKYSGGDTPIVTNIYPVPNLKNPFLGVHYTVTVDGTIKIGPTAIPAFWRENYEGFSRFSFDEMMEILWYETKLFVTNRFNFRSLAFEEFKKYSKKHLAALARDMVKSIDEKKFDTWSVPGIRAQLLDTETLELVQDFVVEGDENSIHILNAVSPAFTCSLPFAEWVVEKYVAEKEAARSL
ncbi:L-2-hydroxyglutarate oxidase [Hydrogenimonas urashimensis]|uniref:L-2-hydroxyglutarate oxidase n=1 Tax=Hydrogenimonas urashimensis TaxID=2740515 RepID=UPI001915E3D6|nr:L-2-hydroxyglutarate oxidase [Hydrogenimonas urashimensis]